MSQVRHDFHKLNRLPPYVFSEVDRLKMAARRAGEDIVDLGMGNPDLPTPPHVIEKICEAARDPRNHGYSSSRGLPNLRAAICEWYARRHGVELDPEREAITVMGAKEGLSHFVLMTIGPGDGVLCPDPAYPIHQYSVIIAGGDLRHVPLTPDTDFVANLEVAMSRTWPRPKLLILSFPHNPTTTVVDRAFFERIVAFAREHDLMVIHDFAYAEVCFDGYKPPSILEVPGAKEIAIEFTSLSKSHSMAGWRVGFACGNRDMVYALGRIKSYLDYGMPQAIQIGAIVALRGPQDVVAHNTEEYRLRRDALETPEFLVVVCAFGLLFVSPWLLWEFTNNVKINLTPVGALAVLYSAIGSLLLAYAGWSYVVTRLGAARAGATMHLMPAIGVGLAALFLGETPRWYHFAGIALILTGVGLSTFKASRASSSR